MSALPAPLAFAAERAIGALLRVDPDTRERLARLDGRVVKVVVTSPAVEFALSVVDGRVDVFGAFDGDADVTITGPLGALRSLADGNDALYSGDVRIEGEIAVAQALSDVVGGLDVDLEDVLAPVLGGTLARRAGLLGRDAGAWFGRTRASFRENVEDYLKEEAELLPTADETHRWAVDIDDVRAAGDRLEARIARLERRRALEREGIGRNGDEAARAGDGSGDAGADTDAR